MKSNQKIYSINAIVIIIDIFTKLLVTTKLKENDLISIIPNFFSIYYVKNTGAAFSILQDSTIFLVILDTINQRKKEREDKKKWEQLLVKALLLMTYYWYLHIQR